MKIVIVSDEDSSLSLVAKQDIINLVVSAVGGCVPIEISESVPLIKAKCVAQRVSESLCRIEALIEQFEL